jgi:hypothetical protein
MKIPGFPLLSSLMILCLLFVSSEIIAQKATKVQKLDKRKYAIEIRETTTEGKRYEKDVFEFTPKEIVSDYFESKFKIPTMHYKTVKDSTFTEDGDELKYYQVSAKEKTVKPDENFVVELIIKGKEISGKVMLMKGEAIKKSWEFEGTQSN